VYQIIAQVFLKSDVYEWNQSHLESLEL